MPQSTVPELQEGRDFILYKKSSTPPKAEPSQTLLVIRAIARPITAIIIDPYPYGEPDADSDPDAGGR